MLVQATSRRLDQPIAVSLEGLVPKSNFYRLLEAKLDLSFVREWAQELYAERGRPPIDPVVFFKLQLVMFFEGIRSERQLIATASLNLVHRWYLGYALDEDLPDHSSWPASGSGLGLTFSNASSRRWWTCARKRSSSGAGSCTSMPPRSRPTPASRPSSPASATRP
jgi:transposase-like protein DUF772